MLESNAVVSLTIASVLTLSKSKSSLSDEESSVDLFTICSLALSLFLSVSVGIGNVWSKIIVEVMEMISSSNSSAGQMVVIGLAMFSELEYLSLKHLDLFGLNIVSGHDSVNDSSHLSDVSSSVTDVVGHLSRQCHISDSWGGINNTSAATVTVTSWDSVDSNSGTSSSGGSGLTYNIDSKLWESCVTCGSINTERFTSMQCSKSVPISTC